MPLTTSSSASRSTCSSPRGRSCSPARRPRSARRRTRQTCPVCIGLPGALPVMNRERVSSCAIRSASRSARRSARTRSGTASTTTTPTCRRAIRSASTTCRCRRRRLARHRHRRRATSASASSAPTSKRTPARACTTSWPASRQRSSTSTAPARRCWRSSPSPTCAAPPRRPRSTTELHALLTLTSASPTATCRRAACAATPTSSLRAARRDDARHADRRDQEPQQLPLRRAGASSTRSQRQIERGRETGGTIGAGDAAVRPGRAARRARSAARKSRTTTATSPIPTCRRWSSTPRVGSTRSPPRCPSCRGAMQARVRDRLRALRLRRDQLTATRRARRLLRERSRAAARRTRRWRRQLGAGRALRRAQQGGRRIAPRRRSRRADARRAAQAHRRRHHHRHDRQGRCSTRCGPARAAPTRSSRRRACARSPTPARSTRSSTTVVAAIRRSSPSTAPARTRGSTRWSARRWPHEGQGQPGAGQRRAAAEGWRWSASRGSGKSVIAQAIMRLLPRGRGVTGPDPVPRPARPARRSTSPAARRRRGDPRRARRPHRA